MIDKFTAIIKNSSDSSVCDLQILPQDQKILTVSPTSLSLIDISEPNTANVLSTFNITEKIQTDHGVFVSAACLSIKEFTILTSKGQIARFNIDKSNKIMFSSVEIPQNSYYTCVTQYLQKYYIAGDDKGHFIILSPDLTIIYNNGILENSIKNITISQSYGLIFLDDGTLYSFKISNLSNEKKEFELELWPELEFAQITPTKICSSNKFNTNAIYDQKGVLYIISKKDDMTNYTQKIFNLHNLLAMSFSNDENLLILVFKEKIGIWNSKYRRIFYVYLPEIQVCNSIAVSSKFAILSIDKGIAIYPLIHRSKSIVPLMFSPSKIFEFVPTNDGILSREHEITLMIKDDDSKFIEFAAADKYSKFIGIATKHRVFIYNRNSQQIKLIADKIPLIRDIEWFSRSLCVLSFEASNASFHLYLLKTKKNSNEFQLGNKIKLPSRPFQIRSNNDDLLIISLYRSILIINKELNESSIKVPAHLEDVYPHTNFIFALTSPNVGQKNLISITYDGQISLLKENVDAFFVSHKFDLLFALSGTEIFVTSTSHFSFTTFICTDSIPIGVTIPNSICAFITLKNDSTKIDPSLSFFFDYAISFNEHFSAEKKKKALLALNSNDKESKKSIILQSSVFLLRQKKGSDCVSFVSNFPDVFNEVMVNAIRCVESNEREDVYNYIGSPSIFFASLTKTKIIHFDEETVKYVNEKKNSQNKEDDDDDNDFRLSSHLLPVILEDEGFTFAFPAAFYLIENIYRFRKDYKSSIENQINISKQENDNSNKSSENTNETSENNNSNSDNATQTTIDIDNDFVDDFEYTQNEYDILSSFFRFIDPILGHVSAIDPDHVSVLGMEMSNTIYADLKQQYEEIITEKLRRMLKFYRPIQMLQFSEMAHYSAHYFLNENHNEYEKESVEEIVKNIKLEDFNNDQISFDTKKAADLFKRADLKNWESAILLVAKKIDEDKKSAEK